MVSLRDDFEKRRRRNRFPRGEGGTALAVTEEECGRKSHSSYRYQAFSWAVTPVEAFGCSKTLGYLPHSSSAPPGHLPPGGRDTNWCFLLLRCGGMRWLWADVPQSAHTKRWRHVPIHYSLLPITYLPPTVMLLTRIRGWPTLVGTLPLEEPHMPWPISRSEPTISMF